MFCWQVPWNSTAVDAASERMFVELAQERAKLQPFLFSAYRRQSLSGVPVCRAMTVDYDNDTASFAIDDQFLLGDGLMVAPVTEQNNATCASDTLSNPTRIPSRGSATICCAAGRARFTSRLETTG